MRILWRVTRWLLYGLAGIVVLVLLAFGFVQTDWGKRVLAGWIGDLASSEEMTIAIGGIEGFLPFTIRLADVAVSDADGPLVTVDRAELDWSPLALIGGTVSVDRLDVGTVSVDRLPAPGPETAEPPADAGNGVALPDFPSLPVALDIETLSVDHVILAEPVFGVAADLSVEGAADITEDSPVGSLDLAIRQNEGDGATSDLARVAIAYDGTAGAYGTATVDARVVDRAGGLLATLIGLPDAPAIDLTVMGEGPLEDWRADLDALIGGDPVANGTLTIASDRDGRQVTGSLMLRPSRFLPTDMQPLLGDTVSADLDLVLPDDGRPWLRAATLEAAIGTIEVAGTADNPLAGRAVITAPDADPLSGLVADLAWRDLVVTLEGGLAEADVLAAPAIDLQADWQSLSVPGVGDDLPPGPGSLTLAARFDDAADSLVIDEGALDAWATTADFSGAIDLVSLAIDLVLDAETADLATFRGLAGLPLAGGATIGFDGTVTPDRVTGRAAVTGDGLDIGVPEAAMWIADGIDLETDLTVETATGAVSLADLALAGDGWSLSGNAEIGADSLTADATASLADLARLQAMTGDPTLAGPADVGVDGTLAFDLSRILADVTVTSPGLTAGGERLDAVSLSGRALLGGAAEETDTAPGTEETETTEETDTDVTALGLALTLEGSAEWRETPVGLRATASAPWPLAGTDGIAVDLERLSLGPLSATGTAMLAADPLLSEAELSAEIADLGPLGALGGLDGEDGVSGSDPALGGGGTLTARLADGRADLTLALGDGRYADLASWSGLEVQAAAALADPLATLTAAIDLAGADIAAAEATLDSLSLTVRPAEAQTVGGETADGETATVPDLALSGRAAGIGLTGLGTIGGADLELVLSDPAGLGAITGTVTAEGVALDEAGVTAASVLADVSVNDPAGALGLDAEVTVLDLVAGGQAIARAEIAATGTPVGDAPVIDWRLALAGDLARGRIDGSVDLAAALDAGDDEEAQDTQDTATGIAVTLERLALTALGLPVDLDGPARLTLAPDGALALSPTRLALAGGTLTAAGRLAGEDVDATLALDGLQLGRLGEVAPLAAALADAPPVTGTLTGTARVIGTLTEPDLSFDLAAPDLVAATGEEEAVRGALEASGRLQPDGTLALDAAWDDLAVPGLVLPSGPGTLDIAGRLDRAAGTLALERAVLAAWQSRVDLSGTLDLERLAGPVALTVTADELAVWRDLAGLPLSGQVSLGFTGDAGPGLVDGRLTLTGDGLATGIAEADPWLRGDLSLAGDVTLDPAAGTLTLADLTASADGWRVTGTAGLTPDAWSADLTAELDDLARLRELTGDTTLAGPVTLRLEGEAPADLAEGEASVTVTSPGLTAGGERLDAVSLSGRALLGGAAEETDPVPGTEETGPVPGTEETGTQDAQTEAETEGGLALVLEGSAEWRETPVGLRATASAPWPLAGTDGIAVDLERLSLGPLRATGTATLAADPLMSEAELTAEIADLGPLGALGGLDGEDGATGNDPALGGSGTLTARLADGRADLTLALGDGRYADLASWSGLEVQAAAALADPLATLTAAIDLAGADIAAAEATLDSLSLTVRPVEAQTVGGETADGQTAQTATVPDLAVSGRAAGIVLAGLGTIAGADLDLVLADPAGLGAGGGAITGTVTADGVALEGVTAATVLADVSVNDPAGALDLDAEVTVLDLVAGGQAIARAEIAATGTPVGETPVIDWRLALAGDLARGRIDGTVDLVATLDVGDDEETQDAQDAQDGDTPEAATGIAVTLERLALTALGLPVDLDGPARLTLAPDGALALSPTRLALAGGTLTAAGRLAGEDVDATLALDGLRLGRLGEVAPLAAALADAPPVTGTLTGTARVTGTLAQPDLSFEIAAPDLVAVTGEEEAVRGALEASGRLQPDGTLALDAAWDDLAVPGLVLPAGPGTLDVAGRLDRAAGTLALERAVLAAWQSRVELSGTLDLARLAGPVALTVTADELAVWRDLPGLPLSGRATLGFDGEIGGGDAGPGLVDGRLTLTGDGLATGIAEADPWLRGDLSLAGDVTLDPAAGTLTLADLAASADGWRVSGTAGLTPEAYSADLTAALDDLARLRELTGDTTLAGPVTLRLEGTAPLTGPADLAEGEASVTVTSPGLTAGGERLDAVSLSGRARLGGAAEETDTAPGTEETETTEETDTDVTALGLALTLEGSAEWRETPVGLMAMASAPWPLAGTEGIAVDLERLSLGPLTATGTATLAADPLLSEAELTAEIADLGPLGALGGLDGEDGATGSDPVLGGSGTLTARLADGRAGLTLALADGRYADLAAWSGLEVQAAAALADPLATLTAAIDLAGADIAAAEATLDSLSLTVRPVDGETADGETAETATVPDLALSGRAAGIGLTGLGTIAGADLELVLADPAGLGAGGGAITGTVTAEGVALDEAGVTAAAVLADVSVNDPAGALGLDAEVTVLDLVAGGQAIARAEIAATGTPVGDTPVIDWRLALAGDLARGRIDGTVDLAAALDAADDEETQDTQDAATGIAVTLQRLALTALGLPVDLDGPARLTLAPDGALALSPTRLALAGGTLTAAGRLAGEDVDATLALDGMQLGRLGEVAPLAAALADAPPVTGTLTGTARVTGTLAEPDLSFDLAAPDLVAATGEEEAVRGALEASGRLQPDGTLALDAAWDDLAVPGLVLPAGPGTLDIAGRLDRASGTLALERAVLAAWRSRVDLSGTLDLERLAGPVALTVTADELAVWRDLAGLPLSGAATLGFEGEAGPGLVDGRLTLTGDGLATGLAEADPWLRGDLALAGDVTLDPAAGTLTLADLAASAEGWRVSGTAGLTPQAYSADLTAELDDLARLRELTGDTTLAGPVTLRLEGTAPADLAEGEASVTVTSPGLTAGGERLDAVSLSGRALLGGAPEETDTAPGTEETETTEETDTEVTAPGLALTLEGSAEWRETPVGLTATASAPWPLAGTDGIAVDLERLSLGPLTATGTATLAADPLLSEAELSAEIADLGPLGALGGLAGEDDPALGGSGTLTARLADGRADLTLALGDGRYADLASWSGLEVQAAAALADPLATLTAAIDLAGADIAAAEATLDSLSLTVRPVDGETADGEPVEAQTVDGETATVPDLALSGRAAGIGLTGLGTIGGADLDLVLADPAGLGAGGGAITGTVTADGVALDEAGVTAATVLADVSVNDPAGALGLDAEVTVLDLVAGGQAIARAEIAATGTPVGETPVIDWRLALAGELARGRIDGSVDLAATLDAGDGDATQDTQDTQGQDAGTPEAGTGIAVTLERLALTALGLPVDLDGPARLTLAPDGALALSPTRLALAGGTLTAAGRLAGEAVDATLALDGLQLGRLGEVAPLAAALADAPPVTGTLTGTARVTGTLAQPDLAFEIAAPDLVAVTGADDQAGAVRGALEASGRLRPDGTLALDAAWDDLAVPGLVLPSGPGTLDIAGRLDRASGTLALERAVLAAWRSRVDLSGTLDLDRLAGPVDLTVTADDLAVWRDLAGLPLSGAATLGFTGEAGPGLVDGRLTLTGDGLATGLAEADPWLRGDLSLAGDVTLEPAAGTLTLADLAASADGWRVSGTAGLTPQAWSADLTAELDDLARLRELTGDASLAGPVTLRLEGNAPLTGPADLAAGEATVTVTSPGLTAGGERLDAVSLSGRALLGDAAEDAQAGTEETGTQDAQRETETTGETQSGLALVLEGSAEWRETPVGLTATASAPWPLAGTEGIAVDLERLSLGPLTATGTATLAADPLLSEAELSAEIADLGPLGAIGNLGQEIGGSGTLSLTVEDGEVQLTVTTRDGRFADLAAIDSLDVAVTTSTVNPVGDLNGTVTAAGADIAAAGAEVESLSLSASPDEEGVSLTGSVRGVSLDDIGTVDDLSLDLLIEEAQRLAAIGGTVSADGVDLAGFQAGGVRLEGRLEDPAGDLGFEGRVVAENAQAGGEVIQRAEIDASGTLQAIDFEAALAASIANGRLAGSVSLPDGDAPDAPITVTLASASVTALELPLSVNQPTEITIAGDGTITVSQTTIGVANGTVSGQARITDGALEANAELSGVQIDALSAVADLPVSGTVSGSVAVAGSPAAPQIDFDLSVPNLVARDVGDDLVARWSVTASGTLNGDTLTLDSTASGALGDVTAGGTVDLAGGPDLDLTVSGAVALASLNPLLAAEASRIGGDADAELRITGSAANPDIGGRITVSEASFVNPILGLSFDGINGTIASQGTDTLVIDITGRSGDRGTVEIGGTARFGGDAILTLDAQVRGSETTLVAMDLVTARADLDLAASGTLADGFDLGGTIALTRVDADIPTGLGASVATIDVVEINPVTPEQIARVEAQNDAANVAAGSSSIDIALDINVSSNNTIFVTGLGLEAQFGGEVDLGGTGTNPRIVGDFEMRRGSLDFLDRRFQFSRGEIEFTGNPSLPRIDFEASLDTAEAEVFINLTGDATDPDILFSSSPSLPDDEILALILFGRRTSDLSALEAVRLAQEIGTLTGTLPQGPGILSDLQNATGIDQIDVSYDEETGDATVSLGTQLTESVRVGVVEGGDAGTAVEVEIDLTPNIRVNSEVGTEDSRVGVSVEWDY